MAEEEMKKNILSIFIGVTLFSCTKKTDNTNFKFHTIVSKVEDAVNFNDIVEDYKYIKLQTNNNCLLGKVNQVLIYKSKIYILTKEIYCFNMEGKFLFSINQKGKGPSEFINIYNFSIDNDIIYLNTPWKVLSFNSNTGDFIKGYKLEYPVSYLGFDGNKMYIDRTGLPNKYLKGKERILISSIDNQKDIESFFPEEKYEIITENQFIGYNKHFYFIDPYLNQVYKIYNNQIENYISFDFGNKNPTEAEVAARVLKKQLCNGYAKAALLNNVYETPNMVMANIWIGKDWVEIFFDKKTNHSLAFNIMKGVNGEPYQIFPSDPIAVYEDYFCGVITAQSICTHKETIIKKNILLNSTHREYNNYDIIKRTNIEDNPIIMMFKLKSLK